jgi:hypothetical protein
MKFASMIFVLLAGMLGLVAPSASQVTARSAAGIPGYLDPRTGEFHVRPAPASGMQLLFPAVATTGTFVYDFTITILSTDIPTTDTIVCISEISLSDTSSSRNFSEDKAVKATRTGSTATCTVTVPYSWNLGSPTSDMVGQGVFLEVPLFGTAKLPQRLALHTLTSIKVPASGTTTTNKVSITI